MSRLTPNQLLAAISGRWHAQAPLAADEPVAGGFVIDSREAGRGDVFWALEGEHTHGAKFLAEAFARGAVGAVSEQVPTDVPADKFVIVVPDAVVALGEAALGQRRRFAGRVVAVTGSVGKTTTRQLIEQVLGRSFQGTASRRNHNNHLGVPLSMLAWSSDDDYAVLELGASAVGEIRTLAEVAAPHLGVITGVGEAHLGGFGSREAIVSAKCELLEGLPGDGLAVLNGDDARLRRLPLRPGQRTLWVGRGLENDLVATHIRCAHGQLEFFVDRQPIRVPVWGRHHVVGVLAAMAVGREFGASDADIATALAEFRSPPMRCEVTNVRGAALINDAYNSNPTAMRAALEVLRDFDSPGQRIVVCGDMRELGPESIKLHRTLGDEVVTLCGADLLVACGEFAEEVVAGAQAAGMSPTRTIVCRQPEEAGRQVSERLAAGDVVLVKGSRTTAMER
ncbi:MAG TPA: UDP-N-acetylmuramoyl-tripeptide--D-alanyl-D-alanine ligase, partial [Pirellulales bacterium]|nr:UDP-N-acetylmuramoyl-tripeptide--D-alanyl-D-alanine ligase [Pirellulales bacterium]